MSGRDEIFGKQYFDGGGNIDAGTFPSYQYDDFYPEFRIWAEYIKENFHPRKILDIGCAKGFLVKAFDDLRIMAWGIDISRYAIESAPIEIRSSLFVVDLNRNRFPFEDNFFDFIVFFGTIEFLSDHKFCIEEIRRVLKSGGYVFMRTIYKRHPEDKIRINIHEKDFWLNEFQSNGFKNIPLPSISKPLLEIRINNLKSFYNSENGSSIKFKLGKFLFKYGGYLGKRGVIQYKRSKGSDDIGYMLFQRRIDER